MRIAYDVRQERIGRLLRTLRGEGVDLTRWELYAAPFRVDLGRDLRERLAGAW